jgi:hypothetical protein
MVRGIGVFSSVIGTYLVKVNKNSESHNALSAINKGFYSSAAISILLFGLISFFYLHDWRSFFSVVVGIFLAISLDEITKRFTDGKFRPVRDIAKNSKTGSATLLLKGLSYGFEAAVWQTLVIAITIFTSIMIYHGMPVTYVLYGVAMTGIGMLTLTGNNVAMDAFGPIADNATAALDDLGEKIDLLGNKIILLENQIGKNDPTILELKKPYTLLMIRHYMLSETVNNKCGTNKTLLIFIYSNNPEYIADSEKQGYVIDYVKKKFSSTNPINVYSIVSDIGLEMTQTLLQFYNVEKIPSLIINEKLYSGFQDKDTLEGILKGV